MKSKDDITLKSLRPVVKGKIIHVFGSAGARDVTKRPLMGKMSSKYADIIILTSEDPRREPVEKIMSEIESGINKKVKWIAQAKTSIVTEDLLRLIPNPI